MPFAFRYLPHRDEIELELTWIPSTAPRDPESELFDPVYMSALFEYGRQRAVADSAWTQVSIDALDPSMEY